MNEEKIRDKMRYILAPARHEGESQADYRARRTGAKLAVEGYMRRARPAEGYAPGTPKLGYEGEQAHRVTELVTTRGGAIEERGVLHPGTLRKAKSE